MNETTRRLGRYQTELPLVNDTEDNIGDAFISHAVTWALATFGCCVALAAIAASVMTIAVAIDGTGSLEPALIWPVRSLEDGSVTSVLVKSGDTVHTGQPLVRLDSLTLASELAQARAQYTEQVLEEARLTASAPLQRKTQAEARALADAHLLRARATLFGDMIEYSLGSNVDSLLRSYVIGKYVTLDLAVADVRTAESEARSAVAGREMEDLRPFDINKQESEVSRLRAEISTTLQHMRRLEIRSPANGVVLTGQLERLPGTLVHAGDQVLEVADPAHWRANMLVDEQDVHQVAVGDSATVDVPALKGLNIGLLQGSVSAVALESAGDESAAPTTGQTATQPSPPSVYHIEITIDPAQLRSIGTRYFRRGYSATTKVISRRERIVVLLRDYLFARMPLQ